ncbi:hypothetical protein [Mesorhizobium captivum]|nr:hypothetical protein [Mesorhizobium sp. VK3C]MDX8448111.1 hypothetical protein [Mesorhizobium sp. VK3C]
MAKPEGFAIYRVVGVIAANCAKLTHSPLSAILISAALERQRI